MEYLMSLFLGVMAKLLGNEIEAWIPVVSERIIEGAIRKLPENQQERLREEWRAHLEECPGHFAKLWHAIGCLRGAFIIGSPTPIYTVKGYRRYRSERELAEQSWVSQVEHLAAQIGEVRTIDDDEKAALMYSGLIAKIQKLQVQLDQEKMLGEALHLKEVVWRLQCVLHYKRSRPDR